MAQIDKVNVEFILDGEKRVLSYLYERNDYIDSVLRRYSKQIKRSIKELSFEYNGSLIPFNTKLTLGQINMNDDLIRFLVSFKTSNNNHTSYLKSDYIICPECKENCLININSYRVSLSNCPYGHNANNLSINEFINSQYFDESLILCDECKNKKAMVFKNEFYFCSCGLALCPSCQINHRKKKHIVYNYEKKNYWCVEHNDNFISYCLDCKINLCLKCELRHNEKHKLIAFKDIIPNKNFLNKVKSMQNKFREYIDRLQEEINKIVKTLHSFLDSLNNYYQINEEIVKNYDLRHRNYFSIKNISNYNTQNLLYDMNCALEERNLEKKINLIFDINLKLNTGLDGFYPDKGKNNVTIKYMKCNSPGLTGTMRIFGDKFVEENYDNCYLLINNKEMPLSTRISYKKKDEEDNLLEIMLIEAKKITSMNCMFRWCKTLFSLDNFSQWDTSFVTDMSCMFSKCTNLKTLPDISKWNTSNVQKMNGMFESCESLLYLPNISKWDFSNVKDMNYMFYQCKSLKTFPDISNWNISKATNMISIFSDCKNVKISKDISQCDISNKIVNK